MSTVDTPARSVSDKKLAANRRNARKSTGPRSAEGKAVSARNALKHGLTAREVVLPGEDAEAFEARRVRWAEAYRPALPAEEVALERAVQATWRLDRCARAERARIATRVRDAADELDLAARRRADELGQLLLYEPIERGDPGRVDDPLAVGRFDRRDESHPRAIVRLLLANAQGVDWLLERWAELYESLEAFGNWHLHEMYTAVRLLGRRPETGHDDPVVAAVIVAGQQGSGRGFDLFDYFSQTRRGTPNCPAEQARIDDRKLSFGHESLEAARAWLKSFVRTEMARLRGLKEGGLDERAALRLADATAAAHFDDTPGSVLLRRYETACERELRRAVADLSKMVLVDGEDGIEPPPGPAEEEAEGVQSESLDAPPEAAAGAEGGAPPPAESGAGSSDATEEAVGCSAALSGPREAPEGADRASVLRNEPTAAATAVPDGGEGPSGPPRRPPVVLTPPERRADNKDSFDRAVRENAAPLSGSVGSQHR